LFIIGMDIRKLYGLNLRRLRFAEGLSQEALGARMGVDRANIGAMERGTMNVTLLTLWQACQALGCKPSEFFDKEGAGIASALPPAAKVPRRKRTKL
jgi:transcriptional regulator with XRE-family HTH domain